MSKIYLDKTKGIITDCVTFHNMATRDQFDLNSKLKKIGVNSLDVATKCVIKDGDIFYLYNVSFRKHIEKYGAFDESEQNKLEKMEQEAEQIKNHGIMVVEYLPV